MNVMRLATTKVISVDANCPIEEAANLLSKRKLKGPCPGRGKTGRCNQPFPNNQVYSMAILRVR